MKTISQFLKLIRVDHWIKNGMIFIPAFFSGRIFDLPLNTIYDLFILFSSFCLACSIIYIVNDVLDVEKDKYHPIKFTRPLASGFFTKKQTLIIAFILLIIFISLFPYLKSSGLYVIIYSIKFIIFCIVKKNPNRRCIMHRSWIHFKNKKRRGYE